jgi:hypothetical protein
LTRKSDGVKTKALSFFLAQFVKERRGVLVGGREEDSRAT